VFDRDHAASATRRLWLLAFPFVCTGLGFWYLLLSAWVEVVSVRPARSKSTDGSNDLGPPPRRIPLAGGAVVLAGPANNRVAWLFVVGFTFIFVMLDGPASYARLFRKPDQTQVTGRISEARAIPQHDLLVEVYQYTFTYTVDGQTYTGLSYTRGRRYKENDEVPVVYDPAAPFKSSIVGARTSSFTIWHSLIPLGVLVLLGWGLCGMYIHSARSLWLYRHGHVAHGCVAQLGIDSPQPHDFDTLLSDYYFEVDGRPYQARRFTPDKKARRTHGSRSRRSDACLVLYNPCRPRNNVLVEGELEGLAQARYSALSSVTRCAPPVLAIAAIVLMFLG
jgi:hypothetical protein